MLGGGLLVTPALAAQLAGPASLLAWAGLLIMSVPIAHTFVALGTQHPDAGGISSFVRRAFGDRAAAAVGYWFYFALPFGAPATALGGASYVTGSGNRLSGDTWLLAAGLLLAALVTTMVGLQLSGLVQQILSGVLAAALVLGCLGGILHADPGNLAPFAPHGWQGIASAASLLFFSFAGWEAVTHLSHEFENPARELRLVTNLTLVLVSALYLGLAVTCIVALGPALSGSTTPVADLLGFTLGGTAPVAAALVAGCLAFGAMSAYLAGASRLGAALARDGALWKRLSPGHQAGTVPRPSAATLGILAVAVLVAGWLFDVRLSTVMGAASTLFLAVTWAGLLAGVRLLPRRSPGWWGALLACAMITPVLLAGGWALLLPAALGAAAYVVTSRHRPAPAAAPVAPAGSTTCSS
jgi:amino acid efflux transporter